MVKTLYLMRHGQILFNFKKKIQGWVDSPLTQLGVQQAKVASAYFERNGISFDAAYCSTSERASDTLEQITNMPYTRLKGLKELNFGLFEGESEDLHPPRRKGQTSHEDFYVQFGGESTDDLEKRMLAALVGIMEKEENNNVLAVSHAGACYIFLRYLGILTWPRQFDISNCAIMKFEYHNGDFQFIEIIQNDEQELHT